MAPWKILAGVVALGPVWAGAAPAGGDDRELMLMAIRMDDELLAAEVPTYVSGEGVLVPLGELASVLGLAITVDADEGIAEGWALSEGRRFHLRQSTLTARFDGPELSFAPNDVQRRDGELFLDARLFSKLLPIDLSVNLLDAAITVHPREQLPLQKQRARLRKMRQATASQPSAFDYPEQSLGYSLFKWPSIDQSITTSAMRAPDRALQPDLRYSTYATGELLYLEADLYAAGTTASVPEVRLHLGRKDRNGELLGELGATEVGAGDVSFPGHELVSRSMAGLGAHLTNRPLHAPTHYDRHTFRGELAPGWEVELYRNGALLAYQAARSDGRYEFIDVSLLFGRNEFRLVFYGPQGQQRESTQIFTVESSAVPPGKTYYRLTGVLPSDGRRRTLLELDTGLHQHLTGSASLATVLFDGRDRVYARGGLSGFYGALSGSVEGVKEINGGSVAFGKARAQLGVLRLSVEHAQLFDFESEYFDAGAPLRARSALRLDGQGRPFGAFTAPLSLELRRDWLVEGPAQTQLLANTAARMGRFMLSHQLQVGITDGAVLTPAGQATAALEFTHIALRAGAGWAARPDLSLSSVSAGAESRNLEAVSIGTAVTRTQTDTVFQASVGKSHGMFGLSIGGSYAVSGALSASLSLSIAFKHDEREGGWRVQRNAAGSGAASARVFLDKNGNGAMDPDEPPLTDVVVEVNGRGAQTTGKDGVAVLGALAPHSPANLRLLEGSLEDPYLQPTKEGVRLVPRPGRMAVIELPVQMTGEVTGTLFLTSGSERRPLAGVEVEVVSEDGKVSRTRTAYDGFYDVPRLPPGRYTVRVSPGQTQALGWIAPPPRPVDILADGTLVDGMDFLVEDPRRRAMLASIHREAPRAESPELTIPSERGAPFDLSTPSGVLKVRVIDETGFSLASWAAGLPLSDEEALALEKLGAAALDSPRRRLLIIAQAQTTGAVDGALKRAQRGANQLQRYLRAVQLVPQKRVTLHVQPPRAGGAPLGAIRLLLVEQVDAPAVLPTLATPSQGLQL